MRTSTLIAMTMCVLAGGCVGSGEVPTRVSGQIVGMDEGPLGPGLVLFERGPVHEGTYEKGALVDDSGRFAVELESGGTWGIHIFHSEYQYLPLEITIDDAQQVTLTSMNVQWGMWMDLTGLPTWPNQPSDSTLVRMPWDDNPGDNPTIDNIEMTYLGGDLMEITADVDDPDGDLSRMILVHDTATGAGFAMNPPGPPDDNGNYPAGQYSLKVFLDEEHVPGETVWWFVVSDNLCNNTPVIQRVMPPRGR